MHIQWTHCSSIPFIHLSNFSRSNHLISWLVIRNSIKQRIRAITIVYPISLCMSMLSWNQFIWQILFDLKNTIMQGKNLHIWTNYAVILTKFPLSSKLLVLVSLWQGGFRKQHLIYLWMDKLWPRQSCNGKNQSWMCARKYCLSSGAP